MRCFPVLAVALCAVSVVDAFAPVARLPRAVSTSAAVPALPAIVAMPRPHLAGVAAPPARVAACPTMMAVKETALRSAVKAVGWRITAGIVTAITSFYFTGSLAAAAAIVGWDLGTKSISMFIGERLWNKSDWGKDDESGGADSAKRSLVKALAWRAFAATNTFIGATVLNKGKAGLAGKIAGSDTIVKTVLFYFYERVWSTIRWGTEDLATEKSE